MENITSTIIQALSLSLLMFWQVLWPLILGFGLSAVVQAMVSHKTLAKALGGDNARSYTLATLFGIASSSCSYAAVALARAIFAKGASFTAAMIFELASTNLVLELGVILWVLMGWQFAAAEWLGGILMVILLALVFRLTLTRKLVHQAETQAARGLAGKMEGHAGMDMSGGGLTAVSHYFVMDWMAIWQDLLLGFLIAGALMAWVPNSFWQAFFLKTNPNLAFIEGPLIGPLVAIFSFVCSVGNVPLAAVLWQGGISFGGVVSFIFADLIVLPILDIYRKYYGWQMMSYLLVTFYLTMAAAGYLIELLFSILGIIPSKREMGVVGQSFQWDYTNWLNIIFLLMAAILVWRFLRTGGPHMLRMMNQPMGHSTGQHCH